jgi:hypothetical protein
MKLLLIGMTVACLIAPAVFRSASAQDIDRQCSKMRDMVACTCALQNGGRITRLGNYKKQGRWLRRREALQLGDAPDNERVTFPAKFRFKGWKLQPSPAVEGYLACMRRHGRK